MMERNEGSMKGDDGDDENDDDDDGDATRCNNGDVGTAEGIREETHRSTFAISGCSPVSADI